MPHARQARAEARTAAWCAAQIRGAATPHRLRCRAVVTSGRSDVLRSPCVAFRARDLHLCTCCAERLFRAMRGWAGGRFVARCMTGASGMFDGWVWAPRMRGAGLPLRIPTARHPCSLLLQHCTPLSVRPSTCQQVFTERPLGPARWPERPAVGAGGWVRASDTVGTTLRRSALRSV